MRSLSMTLEHGLMAGQVLQRDPAGRGSAQITGRCAASGDVELRVLKGGRAVPGQEWHPAGRAAAPAFKATLANLRSGGPYRVELRIRKGARIVETVGVDAIFVGDVWILAGQSNMEGIGNLVHAPKPHPHVRAFYMRDEWGLAEEKLHFLGEAVDPVHNAYGNGPGRPSRETLEKGRQALIKGVSPALAFGIEMHRRTGVPQGLIACAHGGTSMAQWAPALRDQGGASLYGAMLRRYEKLGQPVAGMLWYQGESDASRDAAPEYTRRMVELVAAVRRDTGLPGLPWIIVQLGCHAATGADEEWNSIQEQQRRLPSLIANLDVAPAVDLELDDEIHIGGRGQQVLGRRLARLADRVAHKARGVNPGIVLDTMELVPTPSAHPWTASTSLRLTYRNVAGGLVSEGRPAGFSLLDSQGRDTHGIFKTTLDGHQVLLHTGMFRAQLERVAVSYGHGRHPYCNITDREGMSLPAMQAVPVPVDKTRAPDCVNWQTAFLPGVTSIAGASYARVARATGWRKAPPRNLFGVLPKPPTSKRVGVYAMRTTLAAAEPLRALLVLGANAPFKVWVNGTLALTDASACPPIDPDRYRARLALRKGRNAVLVAFAPPTAGAHLGICARIGTPGDKVDPRIKR